MKKEIKRVQKKKKKIQIIEKKYYTEGKKSSVKAFVRKKVMK